jgi:chromosome transmission fidelity protein 1
LGFSEVARLWLISSTHLAKDWVVEQSLERVRRELEADEQEYEERLAQARKREEIMRRAAKGRVVKRKASTQN